MVFGALSDALVPEAVVSVKNIFLVLKKPSQPRQHVMQSRKENALCLEAKKHKVSAELVVKTSSSN